MSDKTKRVVIYSTVIVVGLYFLFLGLTRAQAFLAPFTTAVLLALLMAPISGKFEKWGISRGLATFLCDLILFAFLAGLFLVISLQVQSVAQRWPQMKEKIQPKIEQLQRFVDKHTPLSVQQNAGESGSSSQQHSQSPGSQQQQRSQQQPEGDSASAQRQGATASQQQESDGGGFQGQGFSSGSSAMKSIVKGVGSAVLGFVGFLGKALLVFIYIFFLLYYRGQFRRSILNFVPKDKQQNAASILTGISSVTQNYLLGKLVLILALAVLYSVGLSISGVENAILISILAAVLSLVPYIGNMIGFVLALALGLFSSGGSGAFIGVVITFAVAQFVESYILEPYLVGERVKLHPLFTIIAVIIGNHVWGIIGMVVGIPLLAIVKVIADHVPVLHPLGYALGEHKSEHQKNKKNIFTKVKEKFLRQ